MRQLFKKISLENCISRIPGILPALDKEWVINYGHLYKKYHSYSEAYNTATHGSIDLSNIEERMAFHDFSDNKVLSSNTNGNYGLIVSDIEIPKEFLNKITDYTDYNVNIEIPQDEDYDNEIYYLINPITKKALRALKTKCERNVTDENGTSKTKGQYYYIYNRNIYSIKIFDELWNSEIKDVISKSTLHKYLSYKTINEWYKSFNEYYLLLRSGKGKLVYKDALEYYEYEVELKTEENRLIYKHYDDIFKSHGGKEFYDWITTHCMPKFYINDYNSSGDTFYGGVENYWGCKYLYYPEAIKWASWFSNKASKYKSYKKLSDCQDLENCCDCTEFFKRGGHKMNYKLHKWISSISKDHNATNSASLTFQISLSTSIDDIGEMSIFSNEYKERTDYSSQINDDIKIKGFTGGTVTHRPIVTDESSGNIFVDDNVYMIKDDSNGGFIQNKFRENVFDKKQWVDYTSYYINKYPDEFTSNAKYYSFKNNGEIVFNPNSKKMVEKYKVHKVDDGFVVIDGDILPILKRKYVIYKGFENSMLNGLLFPVDETADGQYFTQINNKTYFAVKRPDGYYGFNFKTPTNCSNEAEHDCKVEPIGNEKVETLFYKNTLYLVKENIVEVENGGVKHRYPKLNGYVDIDFNRYYVSGRSLVQFDKVLYDETKIEETPIDVYKPAENGWIVNDRYPTVRRGYAEILYPYEVYRCDTVSGNSESKLALLKQKEVLTDDFGNEMPGFYSYKKDPLKEEKFVKGFKEENRGNSKYMQPYNGCQLDFLYKVGNVSNLSKNDFLTLENSEYNQYFDGNLLQSMRLFFTVDGVPYTDGEVLLANEMETSIKTDVLGAIKQCSDKVYEYISKLKTDDGSNVAKYVEGVTDENKYQSYINGLSYLNVKTPVLKLFCEFTYYVGAILKQKVIKENDLISYDGFILSPNMNHGVKYVEVDELVNNIYPYSLLNGTKFYVKAFDIIQNEKKVVLNDFNNQVATVKVADFIMPIRLFKKGKNGSVEISQEEFKTKLGFNQLNNLMVAPVFRKEFQFGISIPQKTKSDIYIDRGINKAFDKHLRLQEIKTMSALEQYQNGAIFNIINN